MAILILSIVISFPLFFIMTCLAFSGYITGANIIVSSGCIGYSLLAVWALANVDEINEEIEKGEKKC